MFGSRWEPTFSPNSAGHLRSPHEVFIGSQVNVFLLPIVFFTLLVIYVHFSWVQWYKTKNKITVKKKKTGVQTELVPCWWKQLYCLLGTSPVSHFKTLKTDHRAMFYSPTINLFTFVWAVPMPQAKVWSWRGCWFSVPSFQINPGHQLHECVTIRLLSSYQPRDPATALWLNSCENRYLNSIDILFHILWKLKQLLLQSVWHLMPGIVGLHCT